LLSSILDVTLTSSPASQGADALDAFAWPGVALALGVVFIVVFRNNIGRLLDRTESVTKDGLQAYKEQQQKLEPVAQEPDAIGRFLEEYHSPLLLEVEANLTKEFKERGLTNAPDVNKALLKSLAAVMVALSFEKTESAIWASQIDALNFLNGRAPTATPSADVESFYRQAVEKYSKLYGDRTFQQWLTFLTSHILVLVNEQGITITVRGREYLKWRIEEGRTGPLWG
jgi:hypothetical protein